VEQKLKQRKEKASKQKKRDRVGGKKKLKELKKSGGQIS